MAACAWAVGREFGISDRKIMEKLEHFEGVPGRLRVRPLGGFTIIEDYYNSSPVAVEAALETLAALDGERKIAVLGDMLELGGKEIDFHRAMGRSVAESGVDMAVFFGQFAGIASSEAIESGMAPESVFYADDFEQIVEILKGELCRGDVVLIKGSRTMRMERFLSFIEEIS